MTFCFSRRALEQLVNTRFSGEWKYLRKGIFDVSESRAEKACLELALFLRMLDDEEGISKLLTDTNRDVRFGRLKLKDKQDRDLKLRDVANKIIHASALRWDLALEDKPILICESRDREKWERAEIDVISVAGFCGQLMH
jgi:hypothetical protein